MQVFERLDDLNGVALDLQLVKPLASLQELVHTGVGAQLQENVNILTVFKEVLELADILILNTSVNFNLAHKLLLGSAFYEGRLLNYFRCVDVLRVRVHELEALGETALAEKLTFNILAYPICAIRVLELLFHYGGWLAVMIHEVSNSIVLF